MDDVRQDVLQAVNIYERAIDTGDDVAMYNMTLILVKALMGCLQTSIVA